MGVRLYKLWPAHAQIRFCLLTTCVYDIQKPVILSSGLGRLGSHQTLTAVSLVAAFNLPLRGVSSCTLGCPLKNPTHITILMKHQQCEPSACITGLQVLYITNLATYYNISQTRCMNKIFINHNKHKKYVI